MRKLGENKNPMYTKGEDLVETNESGAWRNALKSNKNLEENNKFVQEWDSGEKGNKLDNEHKTGGTHTEA